MPRNRSTLMAMFVVARWLLVSAAILGVLNAQAQAQPLNRDDLGFRKLDNVKLVLPDPFRRANNQRADLAFAHAVECFVMSATSMAAPPKRFRELIEGLGDECFVGREVSTKRLLEASTRDSRWVFWGRRHRDPEIRMRCNIILARLAACDWCHGARICREFRPSPRDRDKQGQCQTCGCWPWTHAESPGECVMCFGRGTMWTKDPFE